MLKCESLIIPCGMILRGDWDNWYSLNFIFSRYTLFIVPATFVLVAYVDICNQLASATSVLIAFVDRCNHYESTPVLVTCANRYIQLTNICDICDNGLKMTLQWRFLRMVSSQCFSEHRRNRWYWENICSEWTEQASSCNVNDNEIIVIPLQLTHWYYSGRERGDYSSSKFK